MLLKVGHVACECVKCNLPTAFAPFFADTHLGSSIVITEAFVSGDILLHYSIMKAFLIHKIVQHIVTRNWLVQISI